VARQAMKARFWPAITRRRLGARDREARPHYPEVN
jgi:hypothetical protein